MRQLQVTELASLLREGAGTKTAPIVLDVREAWEVETASLPGSVHIPMNEIPARYGEIDPERSIVCLCHHGVRSLQVALFLERQGYPDVSNLAGGIDAWSRHVDAAVPLY